MPFNCIFYYGYFDIFYCDLAWSHLFFVPVYIVKISTVPFFGENGHGYKLIISSGLSKKVLFSPNFFLICVEEMHLTSFALKWWLIFHHMVWYPAACNLTTERLLAKFPIDCLFYILTKKIKSFNTKFNYVLNNTL